MLRYCLLTLLLTQLFSLKAQNTNNVTIEGKVVDSSGDPVILARVSIDSLGLIGLTDLNGYYTFEASLLEHMNYLLKCLDLRQR